VNVCVVLGAGASLAQALYFRPIRMENTRPPLDVTFFDVVAAKGIQLPSQLRKYLRDLLKADPIPERTRKLRMEDVFKDVFFDLQDSPDDEDIKMAYVQLIDLYIRVLRDTTNWLCEDKRIGGPVGKLLAAAGDRTDSLTIITFNHDLLIENEIFRRAKLRCRWCLDQGYGAFGDTLQALRPASGNESSSFPTHRLGECDHARPIRILKLHGSLNWIVRLQGALPTANTLLGQAGARKIHLLPGRRSAERAVIVRSGGGPGRTEWRTWPVIIPPIYAKQALRAKVQTVWDQARAAVKESDRLVFFGYSLPEIDIESEKLFERGMATNESLEWADVINPAPQSAHRYASLAPAVPIRWYPSLDRFMAARPFS
jgi:hypothetical protein